MKIVLTLFLMALGFGAYTIPFTGGDLSYKRIKTGVYEFTLVLERDCGRFAEDFDFEEKVVVGAFNLRNELIGECGEDGRITLHLQSVTKKRNNLTSACVETDVEECREIAIYKGTTNVPISAYGYQFVYSECCRPENIANLLDPLNTGFTLISTLTLNGYLWYTSTPVFANDDPLFSCIGEENTFNPAVTVKEHEEYRFSLCNPYNGQAPLNPNQAPDEPPYDHVQYNSGYSAQSPLGEDGEISIDPQTGVLTYTGFKAGSYSIAICVDQYKKGRLVGTNIHEIQLNFTDCSGQNLKADFDYTVDFCTPGRVSFENLSVGADSFEWRFYSDENTSTTSTNANPVMTFQSPGSYLVELAIANEEGCVDTARKVVEVYDFAEDIEILNFGNCDNLTQDLTLNKDVRNYDINWFIVEADGTETAIGNGAELSYTFHAEGIYDIKVVAELEGCEVSATRQISVALGVTLLQDTIVLCSPDIVSLNPNGSDRYEYEWLIDSLVEDINDPNPRVFVNATTLFPVRITDKSDASCTGEGFVLVTVGESLVADFEAVQDLCAEGYVVSFTPVTEGISNVHWTFVIGGETVETDETNPVITFPGPGYYTVALAGDTESGCSAAGSRVFEVFDPATGIGILNFGNCQNYEQVLKLDKNVTGYDIAWFLVEGETETEIGSGTQITYDFGAEGAYTVKAVISNDECTVEAVDQLNVVLGVTVPRDTLDFCIGGSVQLNPNAFEGYTYRWLHSGITDQNDPSPVVQVTETTRFEVIVTDRNDPTCVDTGFVWVRIGEILLADYSAFQDLCTEDLTVYFNPLAADVIEANWVFHIGGEIIESSELNPAITFPGTGFYEVQLSVVTSQGCEETFSRMVEVFDPATDLSIMNFGNCVNYDQTLQVNKNIEGYEITWYLVDGESETEIGSGTEINFDFEAEGTYTVKAVISNDDCTLEVVNELNVGLGVTVPQDTIEICEAATVQLNPNAFEGYNYQWLNADLIADVNHPNPTVEVTETTRFEVVVSDKIDPECVDTGFVLIQIIDDMAADFTASQDLCSEEFTVTFQPVAADVAQATWLFHIGGDTIQSSEPEPVITFPGTGFYEVQMTVVTNQGCTVTVSKMVEVFDPATDLGILNFGNCTDFNQVLRINKEISGYDVTWTLVDGETETNMGSGAEITYDFGAEGNYTVRAEIANDECNVTVEDVLNVVLGVTVPQDTIDVCIGGNFQLNPNAYEGYDYQWLNTDLIDDASSPKPTVEVTETTRFEVVVTDKNDADCVDTGFVWIRINEIEYADFTAMQDLCADGYLVRFSPASSDVVEVNWTFNIGGVPVNSTALNPVIEFSATGFYEVTLEVVTTSGCVDSLTRLVEVYDPATDLGILNFGNCQDYEQVLTLSKPIEGYDIVWTLIEGDTETEIGTGNQITYDFGAEGNYTVKAEISNEECTVVVENILNVILGVTVPEETIDLCVGGTVTLNQVSYDGYNYEWLNSDLIQDVNDPSPMVTVEASTRFEVIVTDKNDPACVDTGFVWVRINELAIADFNAIYDICNVDKTVGFQPVRNDLISTTWFFDSNDPSKTSFLPNPEFTYDAFGTYEVTLIAESAQGCIDTLTKLIEVGDLFANLDFTTNGGCEGLDYTLELNDPAIGYDVNWYLDEAGELTPIGQGVALEYTFEAPGLYDIRVELANAECARSFVRRLQVTDGIEAPDTTIVVCEPGLIALNPFGRNDLDYTWTPADNLDDATSYNPVATISGDVTYQVTVETQDGDQVCSATGQVEVILHTSADTIPFDTTTLTICEGDLVFLNEGGDSSLIYYWQPESFFEDSRVVNPSARLYASQEFTVTITDPENDCSVSFRKKVIVTPIEDNIEIDYAFVCGQTSAAIVALNVSDGTPIEWTYGDSVISTETSFTYDFGSYGSFEVTARLTNECAESSAVITLINPDDFLFLDTIYQCEPGNITLNPDGDTSLIYTWIGPNLESNDVASPTAFVEGNSIYSAIIQHPKDTACQTSGRVYVFIEMDADIISSDQTEFCMGDTARLSVSDGDMPMNVQWSDPDGILIGEGTMLEFEFEKMGEYTVLAEINGCIFMDTIHLQFRNVEIVASQTDGICPGDEVTLEIQFSSEQAYDSIVWQPSDVAVSGSNPAMATYTPDSNTVVTALVYFSDGCLSMDTVMLEIPATLGDLTISADRDTLIRGQKATLTPSNTGFETYRWEPADYVDFPNQAVTEVIPETTTTFTLTATDENGCSIERTITIVVIDPQCEPPYIFVPRAFSPNGDGMNDILYVRGESIDEVEFIIYDRWGEKMFETDNLERGWDGTHQGKPLPPDVYGYYLNVLCIGGDTYTEKGNVTIIR